METPPPLPPVIRRAQKPYHREGSLLLNSVGKSRFTSYSACFPEARLTQNTRDKGGIHCVLAQSGVSHGWGE